MSKRINLKRETAAYKAMLDFDSYLESTQIAPIHLELIKIRASQINGCAFCVDMHTKDARKIGETEQRIYGISVWRDTPFFDEKERAILALTEEVTLIHKRVSDETYNQAIQVLGDSYFSQVLMAIIIINGWNRVGVTTELMPRLD